jgi:hypothetical protein
MSRYSDYSASQTGDWIMGAARRNPEALLLLAAGCCLLMRSGRKTPSHVYSGGYREGESRGRSGSFTRAAESATRYASEMKDRVSSAAGGYAADMKDRISETAGGYAADMKDRISETAGGYAADMKDRISETAGAYADTVSEFASDARRNISETTERLSRRAQSGMDWVMRDQPLAVALAGLAAGAAVAAMFPSSDIENRTFGPAREALTDAAKEAGENLMGAAGKAGERLKSAASERGLSSEGLKDVASDVAETFASAAKGKSSDLGRATTVPENPSSDPNRSSSMARASEPSERSSR